ncbi:hypothetical protein H5410_004092 [Solanum commersonii]|uniref:Uncharacterized protein n=1 Tax=Solanum commersonii TaxID=4109 RepID=A0A9J6B7H2_SOLCO|nr:hypothetical protein H5410_004092 [Solanum commersonii]
MRTCDRKSRCDFDQERAQGSCRKGRLREEIESISTQERRGEKWWPPVINKYEDGIDLQVTRSKVRRWPIATA